MSDSMRAKSRYKHLPPHRHKCADCKKEIFCTGILTHNSRCGPCFDKVTDEILFGKPVKE